MLIDEGTRRTVSLLILLKTRYFRTVKAPRKLRGGVLKYAAQAVSQGNAEIAKKARLPTFSPA
jgi:hypothetical protein